MAHRLLATVMALFVLAGAAGAAPTCRDYPLVGLGLVVGLDGTGDTPANVPFTAASLRSMLDRLGVEAREAIPALRNVAMVMVTARLHGCSEDGRISFDHNPLPLTATAMGDATTVQGGMLVMTSLMGADGQVYAVGQGRLAACAASTQNAPPRIDACIADGGTVER